MYKIALVCRFGASTSILADSIQKSGKERGIELYVKAFPEDKLGTLFDDFDIILFGPQIQYRMSEIKKSFPENFDRYINIAPEDFGMMNGSKILDQVIEKLNSKGDNK